ncbi:hypothetical protein GC177_06675 [bacterium]|nr:hypothetical protein [bacterium]
MLEPHQEAAAAAATIAASHHQSGLKTSWKDWTPGLDTGNQLLGEVYDTLQGNDPDAINFFVWLFENPKSPIAMKGAISLERHDCVHILLGRGLLPQDEAFVIGYTMGTAKNISRFEARLFKLITNKIYPNPYRFSADNLVAYNMGLRLGKLNPVGKIYDMALETMKHKRIDELRALCGIDAEALRRVYAAEQVMIPGSKESERLPV